MYQSLRVDHSSTVERVLEELRRALFAGEIAPASPLREVALAEALGVARSTIREALTTLVNEGLATREPHRGVTVTAMHRTDVHDVCLARTALETAGARSWGRAPAAAKEQLRQALDHYAEVVEGSDSSQITAAHLKVHRALVGLTDSDRLLGMADALAAEVRLALAHVERVRGNSRQQVAEHRRLLDLLEHGDSEAVAAELEGHLAHAESSMIEAIGQRSEG